MDTKRITLRQPAGESARFAWDAFAGVVGHVIPVKTTFDLTVHYGRVVAADVASDGSFVDLTLELTL